MRNTNSKEAFKWASKPLIFLNVRASDFNRTKFAGCFSLSAGEEEKKFCWWELKSWQGYRSPLSQLVTTSTACQDHVPGEEVSSSATRLSPIPSASQQAAVWTKSFPLAFFLTSLQSQWLLKNGHAPCQRNMWTFKKQTITSKWNIENCVLQGKYK